MMNFYVFSCRSNDIDAATSAKFKVEQKQREEAKVRKDDNSSFNNKVSIKKTIKDPNDKQFFLMTLKLPPPLNLL